MTSLSTDHTARTRTAWTIDPVGTTFELKIRHRAGPITVTGALRDVRGTIGLDADGQIVIHALVDLLSLEPHASRDPRLRMSVLSANARDGAVRLTAIGRPADAAQGPTSVTGTLAFDGSDDRVEVNATVTVSSHGHGLTATMIVDHRNMGLAWITGPMRAPTELVIRAPLTSIVENAQPTRVHSRPRRTRRSNSRYRFMSPGHAK